MFYPRLYFHLSTVKWKHVVYYALSPLVKTRLKAFYTDTIVVLVIYPARVLFALI